MKTPSLFISQTRVDQLSLSWVKSSGSYVVQHAVQSDFSDASQVYSGTGTNCAVNVSLGTHYFRVRNSDSSIWYDASFTVAYEPETTAFISKIISVLGSDTTNKPIAIDNLVKGLKRLKTHGVSVWDKMRAIYPRYGTVFGSQNLNLKNVDLFPITNVGTPTRTLGATDYNGISQAELTGLRPKERLEPNDVYLSIYSFENVSAIAFDIACRSNTFRFGIQIYAGSLGMACYLTGDSSQIASLYPHRGDGRFVAKRKDNNVTMMRGDSVQRSTKTTGNITLPDQDICLGAINNLGTPSTFSTKRQGVVMIGNWVSDYTDYQLNNLIRQYYIDIGLITGDPLFDVDGNLDFSGILTANIILN